MSHVFISYSRKNPLQRDKLLKLLDDFAIDSWCNTAHTPGSEKWRDSIDEAIEQSFAVVVIMTKASMKSHYVTYEWARAMGIGIEVVPLLFETLPKNINSKNPLPDRRKWIDCRGNNFRAAIERVQELRYSTSFDWIVGSEIERTIMPFRLLSRTALWVYPYTDTGVVPFEKYETLIEMADDETISLYLHKLGKLWLSYTPAFTYKQKRLFNELMRNVQYFWELLNNVRPSGLPQTRVSEHSFVTRLAEIDDYRREKLDRLFDLLVGRSYAYQEFDTYLEMLSNNTISQKDLDAQSFSFALDYELDLLGDKGTLIKQVLEQVKETHPKIQNQ